MSHAKKQTLCREVKTAKHKLGPLIITGYRNKLSIERRANAEPSKEFGHHYTAVKIELTSEETDDLFAVLPQAILERERAKKANRPKGSSCYSADIIY